MRIITRAELTIYYGVKIETDEFDDELEDNRDVLLTSIYYPNNNDDKLKIFGIYIDYFFDYSIIDVDSIKITDDHVLEYDELFNGLFPSLKEYVSKREPTLYLILSEVFDKY